MWELYFFLLFLVSLRQKVTINENISFIDYEFGIRLPDCSKLAVNWKNSNKVKILRHDIIANFFCCCFVFLVKFSYWSKFHVNIITGSVNIITQYHHASLMSISFYKELTRNPEIVNTHHQVVPISRDWGK